MIVNLWIASKDSLPHKVSEVEWVTDQWHPTKEVCQAQHSHAVWHVDDGPKVLGQSGQRSVSAQFAWLHWHWALQNSRNYSYNKILKYYRHECKPPTLICPTDESHNGTKKGHVLLLVICWHREPACTSCLHSRPFLMSFLPTSHRHWKPATLIGTLDPHADNNSRRMLTWGLAKGLVDESFVVSSSTVEMSVFSGAAAAALLQSSSDPYFLFSFSISWVSPSPTNAV